MDSDEEIEVSWNTSFDTPYKRSIRENNARVYRLASGDWQFGHDGRHHGVGSEDCPKHLHHHHDEFCAAPTMTELKQAGIDPKDFRPRSRA